MPNRETLRVERLKEFEAWAIAAGYTSEPVKGQYEVLRLRPPTGEGPWIFYRRIQTHAGGELVHLTVPNEAMPLVRRWLKDVRGKE